MAFELKTSDDLAVLAQHLRRDLSNARLKAREDPFYSDVIVINSRGMEHWLVQQLAGVDGAPGIQANLRFVTPNELVEFILSYEDGVMPRWGDRKENPDPYDRDVLAWRLYRMLGEEAEKTHSPFEALVNYFRFKTPAEDANVTEDDRKLAAEKAKQRSDRRRYQLAVQLADVYDQYQVYRPKWLKAWREDRERYGPKLGTHDWQPELWRRLSKEESRSRDLCIAGARRRIETIASKCKEGELHRVWLFGVSTMAPSVLALLRDLGGPLDVNLYLRSPSACYWLDDQTKQQEARSLKDRLETRIVRDRGDEKSMLAASLRPDDADLMVEGNPLLASCGDVIRDFLRLLHECEQGPDCNVDLSDSGLFRKRVPGRGLLAAVQDSVRLAERLPDLSDAGAIVSGSDASIRFHSCHSPLREIEILRDNLLDWFNQKEAGIDKHPRNVVVMAPNIEEYVPFIEAVFNRRGRNADTYLPYLIADRTSVAESAVVQAFLNLLRLPDSRFRVSEVFDLLGVGAIARAYKLDAGDVARLQRWVKDANVHWGLNAEHRRDLDPSFEILGEAYGWEFGMNRLLAGYGIAATDGGDLFANVVPLDEVEGGEAARLGRFGRFLKDLREARKRFADAKPVAEWKKDLDWALDRFFIGDESSYADLTALRQHVERLARNAEAGDAGDELSPAVVVSALTTAVSAAQSSSLFCRGKITFCSMLPLRSIPSDVVWLLGMSDGAFPRTDSRRDFNLIHTIGSMAGDRSRRKDDRYLFLEALTSPRYRFHVSYLGRSDKDNSERPPSALVRELMNELRPILPEARDADGKVIDPVHAYLVVDHRLHAFSLGYFGDDDPRKFTYSGTAAADAAKHLESGKQEPCIFGKPTDANHLLPPLPDDEEPNVKDLATFFHSPGQALLKQRLSLYLRDDAVQLSDDEPLKLDGIEGYGVSQRLLKDCADLIASEPDESAMASGKERVLERLRAEGALPPGALGQAAFDEKWAAAEVFASHDLGIGGLKLAAAIEVGAAGVEPAGTDLRVVAFGRLSGTKAKDKIKALVHHLGANVATPQETILGGWDKQKAKVEIQCLQAASTDHLRGQARKNYSILCGLYRIGMRLPLPFTPGASFIYGEKIAEEKKKSEEAARTTDEKARDKLEKEAEKAGAESVWKADEEWLGTDRRKAYDGVDAPANRYCYGTRSLLGRDAWNDVLPSEALDGLPSIRFEELAIEIWKIWNRWGGK